MRLLPLAGVAAAFLAVSFAATDAQACSCAPPPNATVAFEGAVFVFEGTAGAATAAEAAEDGTVSNFGPKSVAFTVIRSWKGSLSGDIAVKTARSSAACGRNYTEGEKYVVYAGKNEAGEPHDTLCSRTRPSEGAADDITVLDGLADPPNPDVPDAGGGKGETKGEAAGGEAAPEGAEAAEADGGTEAGAEGGDATADAGEAGEAGETAEAEEPAEGGATAEEPADGAPAEPADEDAEEPGCAIVAAPATGIALLPLLAIARRRT